MKSWLYFGCGKNDNRGHGFYLPGLQRTNHPDFHKLKHFDGMLAPQDEKESLYIAAFSSLEGWGYSALSWWDRTVDKRPGSNSIIFCPTTKVSAEAIIHGANQSDKFAYVFQRLPRELTLWIPKW